MRRECRERFPPPPISKETASRRSRHASRHVRDARAVMHVGISCLRWRGKRSRHSRRMRTRKFAYLARGSLCWWIYILYRNPEYIHIYNSARHSWPLWWACQERYHGWITPVTPPAINTELCLIMNDMFCCITLYSKYLIDVAFLKGVEYIYSKPLHYLCSEKVLTWNQYEMFEKNQKTANKWEIWHCQLHFKLFCLIWFDCYSCPTEVPCQTRIMSLPYSGIRCALIRYSR